MRSQKTDSSDTATTGAMSMFAQVFLKQSDYSTPGRVKTLNRILIRFLQIAQSAPSHVVDSVLSSNFALPIGNMTVCDVRIEAVAMSFFQLEADDEYVGKFRVWRGLALEIERYFKELECIEEDKDTIDHIFQCVYWPLVCPLTETEVNKPKMKIALQNLQS